MASRSVQERGTKITPRKQKASLSLKKQECTCLQTLLGLKVHKACEERSLCCEKELRKTMARLAKVVLVDRNFYNLIGCN
jgi:hypothetical protein